MTSAFWAQSPAARDELFATLRAVEEPIFCPREGTQGFYALTRHAQVVEAARVSKVFSSEPTAVRLDDLPSSAKKYGGSMESMDDPRHARLRRIVSRSFAPRMLARFDEALRTRVTGLVNELTDRRECDFVEAVATPLTLQTVFSMMGIPESAGQSLRDAADVVLAISDSGSLDFGNPEERESFIKEKFAHLHGFMKELGEVRRERPGEDLVSALVHANVDGEFLTDLELGRFFTLLIAAGVETTRHALSHAIHLLTENPAQREPLLDNLGEHLSTAVEEIVRCATPVTWHRRNLTSDYTLAGHPYRQGDRVILYYCSANRDEQVFNDPHAFNITRSPHPHVGFGGPGPHFCLGAHLARRQMTVLLEELCTRLPGFHATAQPTWVKASLVNGVERLPCSIA
ncbi:cytochrome P450 [Streptomyces spectabilis]|uniref:Cytochrome P450 n=1 Tax=Streptomyces spectabilis TaxID=68270 RepID=A0A516R1M5_STRST|nr:cytochrome P450 [Streptomyces spectabilis]QDQ09556.1 cytochrome P450 [Streptomyces spectabilis]